jgi:hypothetical protein
MAVILRESEHVIVMELLISELLWACSYHAGHSDVISDGNRWLESFI